MIFLKGIKARTLWIITAVIFLLVIGLVILLPFIGSEYSSLVLTFMIIGFVLLTILIQWASFKSFKYKPKKEPTTPIIFTTELNIEEVLLKNKYKVRNRGYGISYLKIDRPNAFKITIVKNSEAYFNPDDKEVAEGDKELDKCDRMLAFEIFLDYKEEDIIKMCDYSIQGKNIYYTAFYLNSNNEYVCPNYKAPEEVHKINYNRIIKELGFVEKCEE